MKYICNYLCLKGIKNNEKHASIISNLQTNMGTRTHVTHEKLSKGSKNRSPGTPCLRDENNDLHTDDIITYM